MRFVKKVHADGERKTVREFLWVPVRIGLETRWLERATIEYRYFRGNDLFDYSAWEPVKFINE